MVERTNPKEHATNHPRFETPLFIKLRTESIAQYYARAEKLKISRRCVSCGNNRALRILQCTQCGNYEHTLSRDTSPSHFQEEQPANAIPPSPAPTLDTEGLESSTADPLSFSEEPDSPIVIPPVPANPNPAPIEQTEPIPLEPQPLPEAKELPSVEEPPTAKPDPPVRKPKPTKRRKSS